MAISVSRFDGDAAAVLAVARPFLEADPVACNLLLTLLGRRAATPAPGRYWVAVDGDDVAGVAFQSPIGFTVSLSPMSPPAAAALAAAAAADPTVDLPAVMGPVGASAAFASAWATVRHAPAVPVLGQRLYRLDQVAPPLGPGVMRAPRPGDADRLSDWFAAFGEAVGEPTGDATAAVEAMWSMWRVWDVGEVVAMCTVTEPVAGVRRVGAVYTPPDGRGRGYAGALVAAASSEVLAAGLVPILYTDLGNPTSNSVYQRIGYRPVAELVKYRLG